MQCRGVKKYGGEVKLNAHVDQVLMERGRATGVLLKSGQVIKTSKVFLATTICWHLLLSSEVQHFNTLTFVLGMHNPGTCLPSSMCCA